MGEKNLPKLKGAPFSPSPFPAEHTLPSASMLSTSQKVSCHFVADSEHNFVTALSRHFET